MDFGFCSRIEDESDEQICLFMYDRATKLMAAVPTPQEGGRALQHLVTEATRSLNTKNLLSGLIASRPSILAKTYSP